MDNKYIKIIDSCRICGSKNLIPVFSLGEIYISNFVDSPDSEEVKAPLELVLCDSKSGGCSLLQLKHEISQKKLYKNYWYQSGVNKTMRDELKNIVQKAREFTDPQEGDFILDIGSNDSTLLSYYDDLKGVKLVGFEPATNLMPIARKPGLNIINDFFNYEAWREKFGEEKAKIITAIAMFYDLPDPNKFVSDIVKCLDRKGVFIIQMNYLPLMLQNNAFDNCCHEHLEVYSITSLKNLLERHGLEIFDIELNDVNGGSFRIYIQHKGKRPISEKFKKQEEEELKLNLQDKKIYDDFSERVMALKERTYNFIKSETEKGKKIYVYGASTKGNTLLQFYGLDNNLIKAAADRNPVKWGKKTVGTLIPIISEEQARKEKPDYFLILPWQFLKEFIKREKDYLKAGGKFIVPLPDFKILREI